MVGGCAKDLGRNGDGQVYAPAPQTPMADATTRAVLLRGKPNKNGTLILCRFAYPRGLKRRDSLQSTVPDDNTTRHARSSSVTAGASSWPSTHSPECEHTRAH